MATATREVTAKFRVGGVYDSPSSGKLLKLYPDYADGRNKEWAEATPAGSIELVINNDVAAEIFTPARAFTITFTPEDS